MKQQIELLHLTYSTKENLFKYVKVDLYQHFNLISF